MLGKLPNVLKKFSHIFPILFLTILFTTALQAEVFYITSESEFNSAQNDAAAGDSLIWRNGTYTNIDMEIDEDDLFVGAEELGQVIFTGSSKVEITGDNITFQGFQYLGGDVGTDDVVTIRGSNLVIAQININAYKSYKYLRIRESSKFVDVTHCNFENRLNVADQNILSILVGSEPGFHRVRFCSFKNFAGGGNDDGVEPIRIGVSTQANLESRSVIEFCYFTNCDGDGELISSKARQNIYRFNTFENNSKAELVLRHGSENIVYGNYFLNGKGGVRVREGQDHYIYNNYFYELDDRAIFLQNESSDPLDNINIAFNTIVDCSEVILGGDGSNKPTNVTIANNIFADPDDDLFEEPTGDEVWISNIASGDLGISLPSTGLTEVDPLMEMNAEGFFGLTEGSPAIDAAQAGFKQIPNFEGVPDIDEDVLFDLMGQARPANISERDLGCNEFPHNITISPLVTEESSGPSYDTDFEVVVTSVNGQSPVVSDLISVSPNPATNHIIVSLESGNYDAVNLEIIDAKGALVQTIANDVDAVNQNQINHQIDSLPNGLYMIRATSIGDNNAIKALQSVRFVKQ